MIAKFNQALAARRARLRGDDGQRGFTLIELMIVIIIIGILATIAIPVFLVQRQGAWDAETKVDLGNFILAANTYNANNNGVYGTVSTPMSTAALTGTPYSFTPSADDPIGNWTLTVSADRKTFTVSVYNKNFVPSTGHVFTFNSATGLTSVS